MRKDAQCLLGTSDILRYLYDLPVWGGDGKSHTEYRAPANISRVLVMAMESLQVCPGRAQNTENWRLRQIIHCVSGDSRPVAREQDSATRCLRRRKVKAEARIKRPSVEQLAINPINDSPPCLVLQWGRYLARIATSQTGSGRIARRKKAIDSSHLRTSNSNEYE